MARKLNDNFGTMGVFYINANGLFNKVDELKAKHRVRDAGSKMVIITETIFPMK